MNEKEQHIPFAEMISLSSEVYQSLGDAQSRKIFEIKTLGNYSRVHNRELIHYASPATQEFTKKDPLWKEGYRFRMSDLRQEDTVLFWGTGSEASYIFNNLLEYQDVFSVNKQKIVFIEEEEGKQEFHGFPVISKEQMVKDFAHVPVVITFRDVEEQKRIIHFLKEHDFKREHIFHNIAFFDIDQQYFQTEFMSFGEEEIFVDAGSFDGNTTLQFVRKCPSYKKIYLFDANEHYVDITRNNLEKEGVKRYELHSTGLWNEKTTLYFAGEDQNFGRVEPDATESLAQYTEIKVDTLDHLLEGVPVTFLKVDLTVACYEALQGARNLIKENKPKIAIAINANPSNMFSIPLYLKKLVPEYTFYLRQYNTAQDATVLYAML